MWCFLQRGLPIAGVRGADMSYAALAGERDVL